MEYPKNKMKSENEMFMPNQKNITRLINVHAKNMNSKMAQENANNKLYQQTGPEIQQDKY